MKRLLTLVFLVVTGCVVRERTVVRPVPVSPPPPAPVMVAPPLPVAGSVDFDPYLSPYGTWIVLPGYGRVWQPAVQYVGGSFYPYGSGGHWVYTDAGWVFDSDYPFAWAVFHYGRWTLDPNYGWVWLPGHEWAPAWVSWRFGGPYIGWAPLGPRGDPEFHHNHWLFVETGHFTRGNVHGHAIDERHFHDAVAITRPVHAAVPVGPPPAYITEATREQIRPVPVREVRTSGREIPPPPPPGRVTASGPPPPPPAQATPPPPPPSGRVEPERGIPAPPPARLEPERATPAPPPARMEPERVTPAPPPTRMEPVRPMPPARVEPERVTPAPPPGRIEPVRPMPPPSPPARVTPERPRPSPVIIAAPPPPGSPPVAQPAPTKPKTPPPPPPGKTKRPLPP